MNILSWYFKTTAALFVFLVIVGMINGHSSVPYWDMWDGYLGAYVKIEDGHWYQWLDQHNEHRIFFSRILFWIDIKFFQGVSVFLLIINFLLLLLFSYLFVRIASQLELWKHYSREQYAIIISILIIVFFSWMQSSNLVWGFQSQFLAAYLFPFSAFYLLYNYERTQNYGWFFSALFMGVLSAGTMANGVLAIPILLVLAIFLKLKPRYLTIIAMLAVIVNFLYFYNFQANPGHGSLSQTLVENPIDFILYIFTYLGNPFYYMLFRQDISAQIFGLLFTIIVFFSFFYTLLRVKDSNHKKLLFVLFAYILYVGGTAFGTAGGRAVFGLHQAIESRYTTPTLFAWGALILVLLFLSQKKLKFNKKFFYGFSLIPLLLLGVQIEALKDPKGELFDRQVAVLALEMGVRDELYIKRIFPFLDWLDEIVIEPKERNLSIFSSPSIVDIEKAMFTKILEFEENGALVGSLDEQNPLEMDSGFIRVSGWVYNIKENKPSSHLWVVNSENTVVGYVLTGYPREDVATALGNSSALFSGFKGYLKSGQHGQLRFIDRVSKESVVFVVKKNTYLPAVNDLKQIIKKKEKIVSVSNIDVSKKLTWKENATYQNSSVNGFKVFGSYVNGDSYKGQMTFTLSKGSALLYKTGPQSLGQKIAFKTLAGEPIVTLPLSVNREWAGLYLENMALPETFSVTIFDNGEGWGQWSAVLLSN